MAHEQRQSATMPENLSVLFVERANAGDLEGLVSLYAPDAVLACQNNTLAIGADAIRAFYAGFLASGPKLKLGEQQPTLVWGELALTSTRLDDGTITVEVAKRCPDGTWCWVIDQPSI